MIRYLTADELLVMHALIVDAIGGVHGVRDPKLLRSLIERPKAAFGGSDMYPDLASKAGTLVEAILTYHVFVDGNKRTGLAVLVRFLALNGYRLETSHEELESVMLAIARKELVGEAIAAWVTARLREDG